MFAIAVGVGLVVLFTMGRLRFPRWPLHPVMFLIWGTYPGGRLAASFLLGWAVKVMVNRYGGAHWYQKLKPLMFGVIAGDMLGGVVPFIVGTIYSLLTGQVPRRYYFMPM